MDGRRAPLHPAMTGVEQRLDCVLDLLEQVLARLPAPAAPRAAGMVPLQESGAPTRPRGRPRKA